MLQKFLGNSSKYLCLETEKRTRGKKKKREREREKKERKAKFLFIQVGARTTRPIGTRRCLPPYTYIYISTGRWVIPPARTTPPVDGGKEIEKGENKSMKDGTAAERYNIYVIDKTPYSKKKRKKEKPLK